MTAEVLEGRIIQAMPSDPDALHAGTKLCVLVPMFLVTLAVAGHLALIVGAALGALLIGA